MSNVNTDILIADLVPELQRGPIWLRNERSRNQKGYNATPVPTRGLHFWRYTDPSAFLVDRNSAIDTAYGDNYDRVEKLELQHLREGRLSGLVTDFGGRQITVHGADTLAAKGVVVSSLSEAVESHPHLVEKYLYQLVGSETGKFEAMNGALWNDGIFVYVPDGQVVDQPLHFLREAGLANSVQFPRLLVVVGRDAALTIIDEYGGGSNDETGGVSYVNGAVEIFGLENSHTRYVLLQRQTQATRSYLTYRARIEANAGMLTIPVAFGGALSKNNLGVIMNGAGAESNIYGLLFGSEDQHFDNHTLQHHAAGHTRSDIDFKVVLRGRAQSAYTGLIRIDNRAKGCEAYQENRNLLLNQGTRAETIPELEILNEDVSCTHGATIGPLDPMEVFYLQARGIPYNEAVRMIVSGFVGTTLKQMPDDLRNRIADFVEQRLEKA